MTLLTRAVASRLGGRKLRSTWDSPYQSPTPLGLWDAPMTLLTTGDVDLLDRSKSYAQIYAEVLWVSNAIDLLTAEVGRLPLKGYIKGADGRRERLADDSPLVRLLHSPWPGATPTAFKQDIIGNMALYGYSLYLKVGARRPSDPPTALEPLPCSSRRWNRCAGT
jgi:hypothetical protein